MTNSPSQALRVEMVSTAERRDQVFRLRYRTYESEGEVVKNRSGMFYDDWDDAPNQVLWALIIEDKVVGTIRSQYFKPGGRFLLAEHGVFGDLISDTVPENARVVSGNLIAIDPDLPRRYQQISYSLLKHHMMVALIKGDWALAAVRAANIEFYKRVMRMEVCSEARYYDSMNSGYSLMAANVLDTYSTVCDHHPKLRTSTEDLQLLATIREHFDKIEPLTKPSERTAEASTRTTAYK